MSRALMHKVVVAGIVALSDTAANHMALGAILRNAVDTKTVDDFGSTDGHVVIATAVRILTRHYGGGYGPTSADVARVREAFAVLGVSC